MTERVRSQVQASEMRFLRRIEGVTLFNKVRISEIRKSLNIEPLPGADPGFSVRGGAIFKNM